MASEYKDYIVQTDKRMFIVEARDRTHAEERAERIAKKNNENIKEIYKDD